MKRLLLLALVAAPIQAHDFWIEPSAFRPAAGEDVTITLRVGEQFSGDSVPRRDNRIVSFIVRDARGERTVAGRNGSNPAGVIRLEEDGAALIGYQSNFAPVQLSRRKFEQYLREEGLDGRIVVRSKGVQRERFARYAKSFLGTPGGLSDVDSPLGWRFELVPLSDPSATGRLRLSVLYEGKPVAGALVTALLRGSRERLSVRSDPLGVATIALTPGTWLIKTVHMVRAPEGENVEWESLWASLTFHRTGE